MKHSIFIIALGMICALSTQAQAATQDEQRVAIQNMQVTVLNTLYHAQPSARQEIKKAAGYAVFSSAGVAAIYFSGSYGHGLAHNNHNGDETYMQMASAGVGLGLGVKDYRTVFIFKTSQALNDFETTGLDLSGNLDLAAKQGVKGGAVGGAQDILPGVRVYQVTETGLLAQVMLEGTKYWRDSALNEYDESSDAGSVLHSNNNQE